MLIVVRQHSQVSGLDVPESAETVAKLAGTERVWDRSYQQRGLGFGNNMTTSSRLVERYAIEPDNVRTLSTGQAVVIVKSPRASAEITQIRRQPPAPGVTR